jgi:hypothetical protein
VDACLSFCDFNNIGGIVEVDHTRDSFVISLVVSAFLAQLLVRIWF